MTWQLYEQQHGKLDLGHRLEYHLGMLACMLNKRNGGDTELLKFIPHHQPPEPEPVSLGVDDMLAMLKTE